MWRIIFTFVIFCSIVRAIKPNQVQQQVEQVTVKVRTHAKPSSAQKLNKESSEEIDLHKKKKPLDYIVSGHTAIRDKFESFATNLHDKYISTANLSKPHNHSLKITEECKKPWEEFCKRHTRHYKNGEDEAYHEAIFCKNWADIERHNAKYELGQEDYNLDVYEFSDEYTDDAISARCGTKLPNQPPDAQSYGTCQYLEFATTKEETLDFRYTLSPVDDQGKCGSCWAFAVTTQVEYLYKKKNPYFHTRLSEQYLVTCDTSNRGCRGGWPTLAFDCLRVGGVVEEKAQQSIILEWFCPLLPKYDKFPNPVECVAEIFLGSDGTHEQKMKNILAQQGPVIVAMYASTKFLNYKSGIFSDSNCQREAPTCHDINHSLLLAGYGTDANGQKYWTFRNSWGSDWGEDGYIRLARNNTNMCNIACWIMFAY